LLALLVEHDVPLQEGLRLAAWATGDSRLTSAALQMADATQRGQSIAQGAVAVGQLPPFLRWALASPAEAGSLVRTLRSASELYRRRAERGTARLRAVAPMLTCVVLAGGVTLLYCLSVFVPLYQLICDLS
jgi:type II secretory pathway component PulF